MQFDYKNVKNPEFFQENRLEAHSSHVCYKDDVQLMAGETSYRYSLNGLWKFHYAKNYSLVKEGFEKVEYSCKNWDEIRVPAHIQMEGYGVPQYVNDQYPWDGSEEIIPGEIPEDFNPVASYVKYFNIPSEWKDDKICISFQGVESGFALFLNGKYVGYSENSFDPADFDITDYLVKGENKLAVRVFKFTSSSWCEDQDFYRFSGIYRDVYLYRVPKCHIQDISVMPVLEENLKRANLNIALKISGKGKVKFTLENKNDKKIILEKKETFSDEGYNFFLVNKEKITEPNLKACYEVLEPKLWSAEEPNLYRLIVEVYDENNQKIEITEVDTGFRRFEMKNNLMLLNGKRIVFKGVNRHEFSSLSGRSPKREEVIKDIVTMKANNINAIRTSHYPDDVLLYEFCNIYGLYLIAENNMESHGSWDAYLRGKADIDYVVPHDKKEWKKMMLDRVNSCYQRDKNNPSILIWSCGNESFGGKTIYEMSKKFKELDPTRLVHYEGVFHDRRYNETSDMESQMYTPVEKIKEFLKEHKDKPFICCEYTHAMGNSCGGMKKYTDLAYENPLYQGGFIWDYIDQSIYKKNRYGKWFLAYGGDFLERPTDYNFSGNGIVYGGDREPSPKMMEVKFNYQNISIEFDKEKNKFEVYNKNLFINTDKFNCFVLLQENGEVVKEQKIEVAVEPLSKKKYDVPKEIMELWNLKEKAAASLGKELPEFSIIVSFRLKKDELWAQEGHEVAFGQGVYKKEVKAYTCDKEVKLVNGKFNFGVWGENFHALFSILNPGLVSYVYGGKEMIEQVPMPNFWRAPVDNDTGSLMQQRYAQWKIASLYVSAKSKERFEDTTPKVEKLEHSIKVTYTYFMPTTPQSKVLVSYNVFGDGTIETTMSYDVIRELGDMPEFGMMFKLNADYDHLKWYGLGKEETYVDRKNGAKLGVYENLVADNMAKYLGPQECGNKCDVRYAKVTDRYGRGMIFFGDELSFSALEHTPHEIENAAHGYELPEVHYTVVRVAKQQMGVAGDDSWGSRVHPEFLIDLEDKLEFTFCFRGI